MTTAASTGTFQAMIAHYEETGWEVRTIDHAARRATLRSRATPVNHVGPDVTIPVVATAHTCRRIWVDSSGAVQETNVPC